MIRDEHARARRRMVRKAGMYTYAFFGAAVLVAVGGSALVAWLLSRVGWPFLTTWLVIICVVLLPSLLGMAVRALRSRNAPDAQQD